METVTRVFGAPTHSSLLNFSRAGALLLGVMAGSSAASSQQKSKLDHLKAKLAEKEAEIAALKANSGASDGARALASDDPVQAWIDALSQ